MLTYAERAAIQAQVLLLRLTMLTYADVRSRMLTYSPQRVAIQAQVLLLRLRMLTFADVCCRVLTYADVCRRSMRSRCRETR
jgi:hypothetical protein